MKRHKAIEWFYKELPILQKKGVLSEEICERVRQHYGPVDTKSKAQLLLAVFAVVGAVCLGLGVILLFAFNWDELSRQNKLILAFLPLISSFIFMSKAIFKKKASLGLREGSAVFNMLSVGAAIALVSQIYHLPGSIDTFLLTWMILSLPLVYLLESGVVTVLYLMGVTSWACTAQISGGTAIFFWPLVAGIVPHYIKYFKRDSNSTRVLYLSSALCLCLSIGIGVSFEKIVPGLWTLAYSSFFSILYLLSKLYVKEPDSLFQRPIHTYGICGSIVMAYILTYDWVWENIGWSYYRSYGKYHSVEGVIDYIVVLSLMMMAGLFILRAIKQKKVCDISLGLLPLVAVVSYVIASFNGGHFFSTAIFNTYLFGLGIVCVVMGFRGRLLGLMNGGIFIMGVLIFTRFVDSSLGILERAFIFIIIGFSFMVSNMFLSKRLKEVTHEV